MAAKECWTPSLLHNPEASSASLAAQAASIISSGNGSFLCIPDVSLFFPISTSSSIFFLGIAFFRDSSVSPDWTDHGIGVAAQTEQGHLRWYENSGLHPRESIPRIRKINIDMVMYPGFI
ncbi:MAG: hypothetical protein ACYDAZ_03280 [Thermoplasmataceae archaeon]